MCVILGIYIDRTFEMHLQMHNQTFAFECHQKTFTFECDPGKWHLHLLKTETFSFKHMGMHLLTCLIMAMAFTEHG